MSNDDSSQGTAGSPQSDHDKSHGYVVVARRYRPKSFEELVGQQQLTVALINAINTNRVGHAYLFTGARGVGKTSTARIFAKALNAPDGPTPHPDGDSDICRAIDAGEDVDVLEIDGASNRGIDEIRQLRANANVRPSRSRFKIYIIDEVHMLTTAAFNALLKTLEEPPPHVKFILCTTDPQKIPITVLSRCQRYDFAPVDVASITERLEYIVRTEGRAADPEALRMLARRAEGSMRDSQSLLEQLLAYCDGPIRLDDVHQMLGTAEFGRLETLTNHLLARDASGALQAIDAAVAAGVDCGQLAEQLLGYYRDMMAALVGCTADILRHAPAEQYDSLLETGQQLGLQTTLAAFEMLDQAVVRMRQSTQPRTLLEIAVVRMCHLEDLDQLSELIDQLRSGGVPAAGPATAPRGKAGPRRTRGQTGRSNAGSAPSAEKKKVTPEECQLSAPAGAEIPVALKADSVERIWKQVLEGLGDMTADFASYYDHVAISAPDCLVVHFCAAYTLQKESCERPDRKKQLETAMARIVGRPVRIDLAVIADSKQPEPTPARSIFQLMREKEKHPLVKEAVELFDAEVISVDVPRAARRESSGKESQRETPKG